MVIELLVLPNIYILRKNVRGANIYVIEEDEGITIVDCGFEGSDEGILDFIESLGSSPEDIRYIILTHAHPDHVGSLPELIDVSDATIFIHESDIPLLERFTMLKRDDISNLKPLRGGEVLEILEGLEVIHAPGHTDGSIVLYNREKSFIITGDVLVTDKEGYVTFPKQEYTKDMDREIESVKNLAKLDFEALLPGHGPPITEDAKIKVLNLLRRYVEK